MKKFKLAISVSYFNDETDDILTEFKKDMQQEGRINIHAEVIEENECHISGIVTDILEVKDGASVKKAVADHIAEHSLGGECFSLKDMNDNEIFTEEDIYFQ